MIVHFRHRGLERLFRHGASLSVRPDLGRKIGRILTALNVAEGPRDMALPGFRLHPLKGDLNGFWAVSVSGNWRIVFRFEGLNVSDVDLLDYH